MHKKIGFGKIGDVLMNNQRKILLFVASYILFCFFAEISYSDHSMQLGDKIVTEQEYDDALPFVNTENVKLLDLPSNTHGEVVATFGKGTLLIIHEITEKKEKIGDSTTNHWFWVSSDVGDKIGWLHGQYISYKPEYPLEFWKSSKVSQTQLNHSLFKRSLYISQFYAFLDSSLFKNMGISHYVSVNTPSRVETDSESNPYCVYQYSSYKTDWGELFVISCQDKKNYKVYGATINKPIVLPRNEWLVNISDNFDKVKETFGNDYDKQGKEIIFRYDLDGMAEFFSFTLKEDVVVEIYFDSGISS